MANAARLREAIAGTLWEQVSSQAIRSRRSDRIAAGSCHDCADASRGRIASVEVEAALEAGARRGAVITTGD
jgi:hypothetical protein